MDHELVPVLACDCHDLERLTVLVVAEVDDAGRPRCRALGRWGLLESDAVVSDDMADAVLGDAMLGRRARKAHAHTRNASTFVRHKPSEQARLWRCVRP